MKETIFKNKNYKPLSPLGGVNITAVRMESYVERPHKILFFFDFVWQSNHI